MIRPPRYGSPARTLRLRLLLVPQDETSPWCDLSSGPASLCAGLLFCPPPAPSPRRFPLRVLEKTGYNRAEWIGVKLMVLTLGDVELLKQLRAAGGLGRNVRELNIRVTLRSPRERWLLAVSRDRSGLGPISDHKEGPRRHS